MNVGDKLILERRYSSLNGYSIKKDLNGKIVTVLEIEDRVNGSITVEYNGETYLIFRDAIGKVLK